MEAHFFRVEHDLLRSEAFRSLSGASVKVYLAIGLHADFQNGLAYPSVRTIAKQAGIARQTVLDSIAELTRLELIAVSKSKGKSTSYKIIRNGFEPSPASKPKSARLAAFADAAAPTIPASLPIPNQPLKQTTELSGEFEPSGSAKRAISLNEVAQFFGHNGGPVNGPTQAQNIGHVGPALGPVMAQIVGQTGPTNGPKQNPRTIPESTTTAIIPGTPIRLTSEGRLVVAVADLVSLLMGEGVPPKMAETLATRHEMEIVAKIILNALYLKSQGKLQNAAGYIRAGVQSGYELLPQVAVRLELRRRDLESDVRRAAENERKRQESHNQNLQEIMVAKLIEGLSADELDRFIQRAIVELPPPFVQRNPTITNPFIRSKVYELAGGKMMD